MDSIKNYRIRKYNENSIDFTIDKVVAEYLYTIFVDGEKFITLVCTPKSLRYLAIGFLHSESIIKTINDIENIEVYEDKGYVDITIIGGINKNKLNRNRIITSGCGKGSIYYDELDNLKVIEYTNKTVDYSSISNLMNKFNKMSDIFLETGGVHSVALSDSKDIIYFEEDIGRHNALDKIIGRCIDENINLEDKIILTSGRITSEIVLKSAKINIACIISRSAVTNVAIDLANIVNMKLIGFSRGKRMNIYVD